MKLIMERTIFAAADSMASFFRDTGVGTCDTGRRGRTGEDFEPDGIACAGLPTDKVLPALGAAALAGDGCGCVAAHTMKGARFSTWVR